jgi:quercetin dioxygenase-like cupin family protein
MPFYHFEELPSLQATPHLSTGKGPVIEGEYIFFRKVSKESASGSQLHYHPNEQFLFVLEGNINVLVGKDRRIVGPGTLIHIPFNARHQNMATEEGPANYLYIKDRTWTLVGVAADEAIPEKAQTTEEITAKLKEGIWPGTGKKGGASSARVEDLGTCFYSVIPSVNAPSTSATRRFTVEGDRIAFEFSELKGGFKTSTSHSKNEHFLYVLSGLLEAEVNGEQKTAGPGTVIHIPVSSSYGFGVSQGTSARYAAVRSTLCRKYRLA